ncbi:hypothetical protein [Planctomycetes bacterium TBK1r]|uniref:Lipoprotein n=1 Tax=Stieleria magnilauensis TaxID=2527963 RepID=A0ABX5XGX1_9BACT|nr:hypothetical protein TBK1r_01390 [Planctomycetes bacterium TBK1r]
MSMRISLSVPLLVAACLQLTGCGERSRSTSTAPPSPPGVTTTAVHRSDIQQTGRTETVFVFSPTENQQRTDLAKRALFTYVAQQAVPGSWVHVAVGKQQSKLASLVVPEGSPRKRIRDRDLRTALTVIHDAFDRPDTTSQGQVNLPALAATVRKLRRTEYPCRVSIYGDPLYLNPEQQGYSHAPGKVTTDASIGYKHSPFQITPPLPKDTRVVWGTPDAAFGLDEQHRAAVRRFNALYIQSLGGSLLRTTEDTSLLFHYETPFAIDRIAAVNSEPGIAEVSVWSEAEEESEGIGTMKLRTKEINASRSETVEAVLTAAENDPRTIAIAINWTSADPSCDIDMYLTSNGLPGELFFDNQETTWGTHFKDVVRSETAGEVDVEDFKNWEWLKVDHARLHDLSLYLNVYRTEAPARVTIVRVWNGERKVRVIDLNVSEGDGGLGRNNRRATDAWRRVSLYSFSERDEPGTL